VFAAVKPANSKPASLKPAKLEPAWAGSCPARRERIAGGRIDRVIAVCAIEAKATVLLTFNTRDLALFALGEMALLAPEED
jgi:hypothetical protein